MFQVRQTVLFSIEKIGHIKQNDNFQKLGEIKILNRTYSVNEASAMAMAQKKYMLFPGMKALHVLESITDTTAHIEKLFFYDEHSLLICGMDYFTDSLMPFTKVYSFGNDWSMAKSNDVLFFNKTGRTIPLKKDSMYLNLFGRPVKCFKSGIAMMSRYIDPDSFSTSAEYAVKFNASDTKSIHFYTLNR